MGRTLDPDTLERNRLMAQQVTCFRSDAGNDFTTEYEALSDDLRHYIQTHTGNVKVSRDLAYQMVQDLSPKYGVELDPGKIPPMTFMGLAHMLARLEIIRPDEAQQSLDLAPVQPVPDNVFWAARINEFFDGDGRRMGEEFFSRWEHRRDEFPYYVAPAPQAPVPPRLVGSGIHGAIYSDAPDPRV